MKGKSFALVALAFWLIPVAGCRWNPASSQGSVLAAVRTDSAQAAGLNQMGAASEALRASLLGAVKTDNTQAAIRLILMGADANIRSSSNGWSALHYAVRNGNAEIVQALLEAGADPNYAGSMAGQTDSAAAQRPLAIARAALDLVSQLPRSEIQSTLRHSGLDDPVLLKSMTDRTAAERYRKVVEILTGVTKET
jgi:hypothetical protein